MTAAGLYTLLLGLLTVAFFGKSDALQCYQCEGCPDAKDLKECSKVTLYDVSRTIIRKISPNQNFTNAGISVINMQDKNEPPESCFKVTLTWKNQDTVYRGCSPKSTKYDCETPMEGQVTCVCEGDGCNSAPTVFVFSSLLIVCLSFVISLLNA